MSASRDAALAHGLEVLAVVSAGFGAASAEVRECKYLLQVMKEAGPDGQEDFFVAAGRLADLERKALVRRGNGHSDRRAEADVDGGAVPRPRQGTGDIDCVYHFALPELRAAVQELGNGDSTEALKIMVTGKRLKDISDLPLDLAV